MSEKFCSLCPLEERPVKRGKKSKKGKSCARESGIEPEQEKEGPPMDKFGSDVTI